LDIEGIRFGFRTCYDFYFYEDIIEMARKKLDVIIGCSYQRTDTHDALEIMNRFLAYNTNAYVLRSSISLGENSKVCGCSMAVAPDGAILANMKNKVGIEVVEFDPQKKYYKKSGFNGTAKAHYEYVDVGRL
jgi:predicted amidohydrolase